jgi:peptidoglycan/xylan/chitin deacetylase (PgdA/CDA1 family)
MSLRHLAAPLLLPLARLISGRGGGLRILMLHDVAPHQMAALERLVAGLARSGRLAVPADIAAPPRSGPAKVLLSFDDGFASNRLAADGVLAKYDAKALFFVCPGLMDLAGAQQGAAIDANIFRGQRSLGDMRLMGWDDLEALQRAGHGIGNHTLSHFNLTQLSDQQLNDEIGRAAETITGRLGATPWFAFPFGDITAVDQRVVTGAARHHRYCRSGVRGANHVAIHPLALRSDHMDLSAPEPYQALMVEGGMDPLYHGARARLDGLAAKVLTNTA